MRASYIDEITPLYHEWHARLCLPGFEDRAMIKELDPVVLTASLPEHGLEAGDVGWVVMVHAGGAGFEVEFVTLSGETVSCVTLPAGGGRARAPQGNTPPPGGGVNWRRPRFFWGGE